MNNLPSILGGLAQGFVDFGKSAVDLFGTGGAAIGDLIQGTGTKNQDDFRKWLYQTDDTKDAAAKGLGTALNGAQTVLDYIPGIGAVTKNPLFNAGQGALGGLADEFKTYGKDYDLGRAGQRALVSGAAAGAGTALSDALKKSGSGLLNSGLAQGASRGALSGAINQGGYAAIDGGDIYNSALQGAGMGALIGGATGLAQDFKPAKTYDVALTDEEKAARIANAQQQIDDIGPVSRFSNNPDDIAKRARINELQENIKAYQNGYDTAQEYSDAIAAKKANQQPSLTREEYEAKMQQRAVDLGGNYEVTPEKQAQFDRLQAVNPMRDDYHTGIRAPKNIATLQEAINSATDIDPEYKALLQKALNDDSITVYSSYPIEEGVFTTPIKSMAQGYAGPNNQVYSKTISPSDIAWIDNEQGNYIPRAKDLGATLAADDMAVNNPKYLVDENGNPRTFYHGSPETNITEFDMSKAGRNTRSGEHAFYFTDSPEVADEFSYERIPTDSMFIDKVGKKGKVYPANLSMNNPLDLDNLSDAQIRELWEYASPMGKLNGEEGFIRDMTNFRDKYHNAQGAKLMLDLDKLQDSPYDGFMATMYPNQANKAKEYAVFDNSKIKMLEDTLADYDKAVNNVDASKSTGGDISVYTDSMSPETRRALDIIMQRDVPVENELYNRIDPSTLPQGYEKLRDLIDNNVSIDEQVQKKLGKNPLRADVDELLDYLYPNDPLEKRVFHKSLNESIEKYKKDAAALGVDASKAAEDMTRTKRLELIKKIYDDVKFDTIADIGKGIDVGDDLLYATQAYDRRGIRTGYPGALDTALSERLDIAPGNTIKITDSQYDWADDDFKRKNLGRYTRNAKDISVREGISGIEGDISTMAHERLHSFQNEAQPENAGRYSKEVTDAYNELSKDLKPYIKDDDSIAKIYGASDTNYYASPIEQESRMLQTYLDNKGYTKNALYWRNKQNGGNPEWGNEINPAFDKFFNKLRDLSKRGVALPAIAALFGGGAYMASQDKDKKEVK